MRLRTLGQGPLVLQLAGIVGGVGLFREGAEAAAAAGFRVGSLDTAGDRGDDPAPGPITWDFLAHEVVRALDALGEERALLWGTSYGALTALAVASRHPHRVRGLLLAHPPDPEARPRLHCTALRWAQSRPRPVAAVRRLFGIGFTLLVAWEFAYPTALRRLPAIARSAALAATPARTLADKLHLLWTVPPGLPPVSAGIPVSILAGRFDGAAPLGGARRLARRIPGARLRVVGFTGHSGHYSRPRAFSRMVHEELRRLDAASRASQGAG
jgi:pimeloyl-ACP methyl ester carboxylesterase